MSSRRPITRAEAKRILEAPLVDAIDLINQFSLEDEIPSESVPAEPVRLEATFRVDSTTTSTNNPSGFENPFEHTPPRSPTSDFSDLEEDSMPYPYPRYNGEADAEAHIRAYLTTWQANHASKRLGLVEANISKIAEFGLSLDGQAASWYSQNEISEFEDFDQLKQEFVQLFHKRIPQRDLMSQFYASRQEANETVPQFVIRFQSLRRQLTRSPTPEELTDIFLTGLREPLRTTLQLMDLSGQPIEEVIRRVLRLDSAQSMSMSSLQEALPTTEETRFRQAIQCTTCLNPGHSALECTLRTHCPICHSRAHTLELCEYNLLNRNAASVRQIEPQATQTANTTPRQAPSEPERPRPRERYRDDNRDWEEDYDREDDYRRDEASRRDYDYRRRGDFRRDDEFRRGDDYRRGNTYRRNDNYRRYDDYDREEDFRRNDYQERRQPRDNHGDHRPQDVRQERRGPAYNYRRRPRPTRAEPPRPQEQQERQLVPVTPTGADRGESSVHCFNCQEPGHYAPQCPHKQKGKQPAVNIITADVQQVTTRSKTKTSEWEEQDGIRKAAQEWVTKANAANVARMRQETTSAVPEGRTATDEDPI